MTRILDAIGEAEWRIPLRDTLALNDIDSDRRVAFFLANCLYESNRFTDLREDLHYAPASLLAVFPHYFTPAEAVAFAHDEERIANRVYANRLGNGDEASGDGFRFRGGGLAHLTGRDWYRRATAACGVDLELSPERIVEPFYAALSAGMFWRANDLNATADADDFARCVRVWSGSTASLAGREVYLRELEVALAA
jgi:putative chitinase